MTIQSTPLLEEAKILALLRGRSKQGQRQLQTGR